MHFIRYILLNLVHVIIAILSIVIEKNKYYFHQLTETFVS